MYISSRRPPPTATLVMSLLLVIAFLGLVAAQAPIFGRSYWEQSALDDLMASLKVERNTRTAKNVIIFVGDGMGPNTVTAARIYRAGEDSYLAWEKFPHVGALKTYAEDKTVTDSGASGTSLFTGVKTNYNVVGLSAAVKKNDCKAAQDPANQLVHISTQAQAAGKSTGFVTTARVTHATPASLYAHSPNRDWECSVPDYATGCKDIGRQMVEDLPARNFNVLMGGGRGALQGNVTFTFDPDEKPCARTDGRDLIKTWMEDKASRGLSHKVVYDTKSLLEVDHSNTDYLLGVFAASHMKYDYERNTTGAGTPSLVDMTLTALDILMKNEKGFLLMVEAEHIDLAHHKGKARKSLHEVVQLSDTVNATMQLLESAGIKEETLVIVTSDHSHTLTISGYPKRGNSILGIASASEVDGVPYTTLSYANGFSGYHYKVNGTNVTREDPSKVNTSDWEYGHQAAVLQDKNTHGGHDVFVYASGPFAHLFHHMHEQNYVAEVVRYAAKIGPYERTSQQSSSSTISISFTLLLQSLVLSLVYIFSHI